MYPTKKELILDYTSPTLPPPFAVTPSFTLPTCVLYTAEAVERD